MNYRHAYHAGGYTDVVKHAVLALLIERLKAKDTPICVLDTHAGIGRYDLLGEAAQKTGEFRDGIARVLAADSRPAALKPYLDVVRTLNRGPAELRWYPGSPRLELALLRTQDRLVLVELHPEDAVDLAKAFAGHAQVKVHAMDGYMALKAFLPPAERRGLVLIDPPYEVTDEFARITRALAGARRRWATGVYAVWYPIKHRAPVAAFHAALKKAGLRNVLIAELLIQPDTDADRLNGCGLAIVNPPWRIESTLTSLFPQLLVCFGAIGRGSVNVTMLIPA